MKKRDFFVVLVERILDLLLKFVSMKTVAALVVTYVGLKSPGATSTVMVALMWITVVGARAYEKSAGLVKPFFAATTTPDAKAGEP